MASPEREEARALADALVFADIVRVGHRADAVEVLEAHLAARKAQRGLKDDEVARLINAVRDGLGGGRVGSPGHVPQDRGKIAGAVLATLRGLDLLWDAPAAARVRAAAALAGPVRAHHAARIATRFVLDWVNRAGHDDLRRTIAALRRGAATGTAVRQAIMTSVGPFPLPRGEQLEFVVGTIETLYNVVDWDVVEDGLNDPGWPEAQEVVDDPT